MAETRKRVLNFAAGPAKMPEEVSQLNDIYAILRINFPLLVSFQLSNFCLAKARRFYAVLCGIFSIQLFLNFSYRHLPNLDFLS